MTTQKSIRIYIKDNLAVARDVNLPSDKSHYLCNVMRCKTGDNIVCFNEKNGEFCAKIVKIDKKCTIIQPQKQTRSPNNEADVWLLFAPLKKDNTDFVIEKSTELGVSKIIPVITHFTNCDKVKTERFVVQSIEAAEQCERLSIPQIETAKKLKDILADWDSKRTLFFMNERRATDNIVTVFNECKSKSVALLVGPEGGFSDEEARFIASFPFVKNVSLGPRILRAETAVVSALAVWQAVKGDWN